MVKNKSHQPTRFIKVLHIDDELNELKFTKYFIEEADPKIVVTSASSPDEAMEMLSVTKFDCVVSDYQMPVRARATDEVRSW